MENRPRHWPRQWELFIPVVRRVTEPQISILVTLLNSVVQVCLQGFNITACGLLRAFENIYSFLRFDGYFLDSRVSGLLLGCFVKVLSPALQ